MRMRMSVFKNMLRQDAAFFDDPLHATGKICTRLATDAPNVKQVCGCTCTVPMEHLATQATSFRVAGGLSSVLSAIGGIGIGLYYGWKLALVILAICPFLALAMTVRMKFHKDRAKRDAALFEDAGKASAYLCACQHYSTDGC
jgi:ABC-type multidrug transport system fused ATPase/permease subunit